MKKLIIITFILTYININCQDSEPSAYEFEWGAFTEDTPLILDSFNIDRFKLGFQWGGSTKMNNALYPNFC